MQSTFDWWTRACGESFSITSLISQHLVCSRQHSSANNYNSLWAAFTRRLATADQVSARERKSFICVSECISIVMYCNAAWMCAFFFWASTFTANLLLCLSTQSRPSYILLKNNKTIAIKKLDILRPVYEIHLQFVGQLLLFRGSIFSPTETKPGQEDLNVPFKVNKIHFTSRNLGLQSVWELPRRKSSCFTLRSLLGMIVNVKEKTKKKQKIQ